MKEVYVVMLSDEKGNFDWVYCVPKCYYLTKEEAEQSRQELIKNESSITKENSRVRKMYQINNKK